MTFLFPASQVETWLWLPPLVSFVLAYFGAMAGVTGAFLLLPFQMSVLGYTTPGVSGTNFIYNVVAIPGTVFRYMGEGRFNWPLVLAITVGNVPGLFFGYLLRIHYLSDPGLFRPFAGMVLLGLAMLLAKRIFGRHPSRPAPALTARLSVEETGWCEVCYRFDDHLYTFDPRVVMGVALATGVVGGAYGIGGGAVLAPFCLGVLRLPAHSIAAACLTGTFISSLVGAVIYHLGALTTGFDSRPDYLLGLLFGLGGAAGGYLGARTQKHIPEMPIKIGLFLVLLLIAGRYIFTS